MKAAHSKASSKDVLLLEYEGSRFRNIFRKYSSA
jgi:hypothetical protein